MHYLIDTITNFHRMNVDDLTDKKSKASQASNMKKIFVMVDLFQRIKPKSKISIRRGLVLQKNLYRS